MPALGALTIATAINSIPGVTCSYIDGSVVHESDIVSYLSERSSQLLAVGLSLVTANYAAGLAIASRVKELSGQIFVFAGNDHATSLASLCMRKRPQIDAILTGDDCLRGVRRLILELLSATPHLETVPGIVYRDSGSIIRTATPNVVESLIPDYRIIDRTFPHYKHYDRNFDARVAQRMSRLHSLELTRATPIELARGCIKFRDGDSCSFCSIHRSDTWRSTLTWPTIEHAMIAAVESGHDYLYVTADELALTFWPLILQLAETQIAKRLDATLVGYARADGLARSSRANRLYEAGFREIMVGFDAATVPTLLAMNKPVKSAKDPHAAAEDLWAANFAAIDKARHTGLSLRAGFVIGNFGLTQYLHRQNIERILEVISYGSDVISAVDVEVLSPQPGALDYSCLVEPETSQLRADALGAIVHRDHIGSMAEKYRDMDIVDREQAMEDYVSLFMPELDLVALGAARDKVREHARSLGVFVGD